MTTAARYAPWVVVLVGMIWSSPHSAFAETASAPPKPAVGMDAAPVAEKPNAANEPFLRHLSLAKAAEYLDAGAHAHEKHCFACHATFAYLAARPAISTTTATHRAMRQALEQFAAGLVGEKLSPNETPPLQVSEVVMAATVLAQHDAATGGKLHALTRNALDRIWDLQRPDGGWNWNKVNAPPVGNRRSLRCDHGCHRRGRGAGSICRHATGPTWPGRNPPLPARASPCNHAPTCPAPAGGAAHGRADDEGTDPADGGRIARPSAAGRRLVDGWPRKLETCGRCAAGRPRERRIWHGAQRIRAAARRRDCGRRPSPPQGRALVENPSTDQRMLVYPLAAQERRNEHLRRHGLCGPGPRCLWGNPGRAAPASRACRSRPYFAERFFGVRRLAAAFVNGL